MIISKLVFSNTEAIRNVSLFVGHIKPHDNPSDVEDFCFSFSSFPVRFYRHRTGVLQISLQFLYLLYLIYVNFALI